MLQQSCCYGFIPLHRTLWSTEVSEGWQREDGVGEEVDGVQSTADVVRLAGLDTAYTD